jgi:cytochrome c oxidase subunit 2
LKRKRSWHERHQDADLGELRFGAGGGGSLSPTNIFAPVSASARSIFELSLFVLVVAAAIFLVVFGLLAYCVVKFRKRADDDGREPAQVYGSNQVELAWTVIPILIVVTLFLATARVIADIQNAERPGSPIEVVAIGHQFWWEYRFPALNVVTANELHIPVSDPANPTRRTSRCCPQTQITASGFLDWRARQT